MILDAEQHNTEVLFTHASFRMIFMRTGGQSNGKGGWAGTSWVWKSCCGTVNRKIETMWDSPSVWHQDWQQRMEIPSRWCKKTTMGLRQACSGCYLRAGHTLYGRQERLKALRRHDYKSSSLHHLYKWLSALFVSVRWSSSEFLTADSAVSQEQSESSWRFSLDESGLIFCQFQWMLCCPLNVSSCVKTLVRTPFDLLSPDIQRASFCLSSSPRNCWDATEAT